MELTPSQLKAIAALQGAGELDAAKEARSAYENGKTYNGGRRRLSTRLKKFISDANFWTSQGRK
jgi:hypothetical protein